MPIPPDLKDRIAALEDQVPHIPAAFHHLFALLPKPGEQFPSKDRVVFLRAVAAVAELIYGEAGIEINLYGDHQ